MNIEEVRNNLVIVVSNANKNVTPFETIDTIEKVGFKNVFIQWYNRNWNPTQEKQLDYIKSKGLNITFAHLGYDHLNDPWLANDYYRKLLVESYKHDLDCCAKNGINLVIMHAHGKMSDANFNQNGINCFQEIADYANKLNIKVAIENTRLNGYLEYLLDNIKNDNLGICFDAGHFHVHFKDEFNFDKFKNKIFAIHLHDNDMSADQHLLPFDGTLNWEMVLKNLKKCNYDGPITIESVYKTNYANKISLEEFYKEAFNRGKKILEMYNS